MDEAVLITGASSRLELEQTTRFIEVDWNVCTFSRRAVPRTEKVGSGEIFVRGAISYCT